MIGNAYRLASRLPSFTCRLLPVALVIAMAPAAPLAATGDALREGPRVGGHVGLAVPLVTIPSEGDTTDVSDQFTLVAPIGVTVKLTDRLAVDFETQVANPVDPDGTTALVVAPGLVYNFGAFAAGLRVASEIGAPSNVGVIPLVNIGVAPVGTGTWFVEAAFPAFVRSESPDFTFTMVVHTGIGF